MFIELMSKDSMFIVNVEHYLLCSRRKILPENTFILFIFSCMLVLERRKKDKKAANAALIFRKWVFPNTVLFFSKYLDQYAWLTKTYVD